MTGPKTTAWCVVSLLMRMLSDAELSESAHDLTLPRPPQMNWLFKIKDRNTTLTTELRAGTTTFLTLGTPICKRAMP